MNTVPTDAELEAQAKERNAVRVTESKLKSSIKEVVFYIHPGSQLTICIITMVNGFTVTGKSACADPKMFNQEVGEKFAFADAERQMWPLLGYALKDELFKAGSENTPKGRVEAEKTELDAKIEKLSAFIHGNVHFNALSDHQKSLLGEQHDVMRVYSGILKERLASWE